MSSLPSLSPGRATLLYVALVFAAWVTALLPGPLSAISQTWPIILALPWSLIFLGAGSLGLFMIFLAGIGNGLVLYVVLGGWRRLTRVRRRQLLLPPAA
jgi:hypothetical protein